MTTQTEQKEDKPIKLPHDPILFNDEPVNSIVINFDVKGYHREAWDFSEQAPNYDADRGEGEQQTYIIVETLDNEKQNKKGQTFVGMEHNFGTPLQHDSFNWTLTEEYKDGDPDFDYVSVRFSDYGFLRIRWLVYDVATGSTKLLEEHSISTKHIASYEINTESGLDEIKSNDLHVFKR